MFFKRLSSETNGEEKIDNASMVKLKNGSEYSKQLVNTSMLWLKALLEKNPTAFYELVEKARNPKHVMLGGTEEVLLFKFHLRIDSDGVIDSPIRDIILSAIKLDMTLGNPIALENEEKTKNDIHKKSSEQNKYFMASPLPGAILGPMAIIEAEIIEKSPNGGTRIKVIAPKELAEKCPTFNTKNSSLIQVPDSYGPARAISFKEYQALWQKYIKDCWAGVEAAETTGKKHGNLPRP